MISAQLNSYRQSPRKVRLVSDLVKGKSVKDALELLSFTTKVASKPLSKLLKSAFENAKAVSGGNAEDYVVKEFRVDAGTVLKRSMPRARGSAFQILKRTSHISLILEKKATVESPNTNTQKPKKLQKKTV